VWTLERSSPLGARSRQWLKAPGKAPSLGGRCSHNTDRPPRVRSVCGLGLLVAAGSPLGTRGPSGLTPPPYQPRLLRVPSSRLARGPSGSGRLVSGRASRLDAFSGYPLRRSCPALPSRTTGRPEAAAPRSSRTRGTFPSGGRRPPWVESDLSHDGLFRRQVGKSLMLVWSLRWSRL